MARRELQTREEERARARQVESEISQEVDQKRIREAMQSTAYWMRHHTKTFNPHWVEEGRPAPHEPFPEDWTFFERVTEMMEREPISAIEKSRDMMASWAVVAYFTRQAQLFPMREIVFQSIGDKEAEQLIDYAKCLYDTQPDWLKAACPLVAPTDRQAKDVFAWKNGSVIWSVPSGKDKIRSYHPWGYFSDESAFQPEGLQCIDAALGTGCKKLVLASTANIGWFMDWRLDNIEL
jgi:hypothetical protein